jgi:hypothetical protein
MTVIAFPGHATCCLRSGSRSAAAFSRHAGGAGAQSLASVEMELP